MLYSEPTKTCLRFKRTKAGKRCAEYKMKKHRTKRSKSTRKR